MTDKGAWILVIVGALVLIFALSRCPPHPGDEGANLQPIDAGRDALPPWVPVICQWEYKTQYSLPSPRPERRGEKAITASSITPAQEDLAKLGAEGWELASTYLEWETAFPQMPDKSTVANVRPQRLVMLFKRRTPLGCWR